jgi:hypothetical protein
MVRLPGIQFQFQRFAIGSSPPDHVGRWVEGLYQIATHASIVVRWIICFRYPDHHTSVFAHDTSARTFSFLEVASSDQSTVSHVFGQIVRSFHGVPRLESGVPWEPRSSHTVCCIPRDLQHARPLFPYLSPVSVTWVVTIAPNRTTSRRVSPSASSPSDPVRMVVTATIATKDMERFTNWMGSYGWNVVPVSSHADSHRPHTWFDRTLVQPLRMAAVSTVLPIGGTSQPICVARTVDNQHEIRVAPGYHYTLAPGTTSHFLDLMRPFIAYYRMVVLWFRSPSDAVPVLPDIPSAVVRYAHGTFSDLQSTLESLCLSGGILCIDGVERWNEELASLVHRVGAQVPSLLLIEPEWLLRTLDPSWFLQSSIVCPASNRYAGVVRYCIDSQAQTLTPIDFPHLSLPFVVSSISSPAPDQPWEDTTPSATDILVWLSEERESCTSAWEHMGFSSGEDTLGGRLILLDFDDDRPIEVLFGNQSDHSVAPLSDTLLAPPITAAATEVVAPSDAHPPITAAATEVVAPSDTHPPITAAATEVVAPSDAHPPITAAATEAVAPSDTHPPITAVEGREYPVMASEILSILQKRATEQWRQIHSQGLPDRRLRTARMRIICGIAATAFSIGTEMDLPTVLRAANASEVDRQLPWLVPWLAQCFDMKSEQILGYLNRWARTIRSSESLS